MLLLMSLLIVVFILFMFYFARNITEQVQNDNKQSLAVLKEDVVRLAQEKEKISEEKKFAEQEASDIFTLYDITKEISKKSYEQEAFEVFRATLKEKVSFEDCRLIHAEGDRRKKIPDSKDYFIFPLQGRKRILGNIIIKGLREQDKDKFIILAQQFGLALRRIILYQEIEQAAITDSLTGIHTRRYLLERFEEELQRATIKKIPLSFLMIDVDRFKSFNDNYGHLVGDKILKAVSFLIQENVREIDYAGRYGGEEFSVVLPDTDNEGGFFVAERIRQAIEEAVIEAYDTTAKVTVSLGISCFPADGKSSMELIDKADWALYRSKKRGRNCVTAFGVYKSK
ncbi:MAG: GGDEF domain-containing protein [Candidatus Aceula meridiana]|nr:GGDEF domain-containing protein [Candidatus Aceula meridiana]